MTLLVFTGAFGAPQYVLRAATATEAPSEVQPPDPASHPGAVTFGLGVYEHEIDESLDTLVPLATPEHGLFFFNPKLTMSDRLNPSVSIGLGYRHLFEDQKIIIGGHIFYDSDYTTYDHHVNQFGIGGEVLTRWVDFRANYYLPEQNQRRINTNQTISLSQKVTSSSQNLGPQVTSDTVGFAGHNLVETIDGFNATMNTFNVTNSQTTHFWEQYEAGMRGVDTEVGFLIPGLDKYAETRIFGGYYFYENPFGRNFSGFKGRLEVRALPALTFDAAYYENKEIVGSNWYYGVRVTTPFDIGNIAHGKNPFAGFAEAFKPKQTSEAERFADRLSENIIRNPHVATAQSKFIEVGQKTVAVDPPTSGVTGTAFTTTIIMTLGGVPITITHVDSAAAVAGDGTFEHPYMTLSLADADAVKRAIVLLHADSTFNGQSITLAANQQLLGDSKNVTNFIQTDQKGTIALPRASTGIAMPVITNPGGTIVNLASNNVVSGLNLTNAARGVSAASANSGNVIQKSTISNMTAVGIGLDLATATGAKISNVTFSGNNQDIAVNGSGTTISNTTSTGAAHGSIDLINAAGLTALSSVTITGAGDFAVRSSNSGAGSTTNVTGLAASGGAAGVDIEGGAGTFNFDSTSAITSTGGAGLLVNGGSANVNYSGNITQTLNAPAVAVMGGHTGTLQFQTGKVAASSGPGLLFNAANGTYNFLGTTTLTGGANLQILAASAGAFTFGIGTSITNGNGQDILIDNSTASLTYSGNASANAGTLLQVNNHSTGTVQFDTGTLSATGGNGLQFNNADGTYKFLGTTTLNGGAAAVDLTNGSDGTFAFDTATTITNPAATAFFVNGGTSNITYSGNITANTAFALQVLNHSTGTIAFNTGIVSETGGVGVQFVNDSGIYGMADTRITGSGGASIEVDSSKAGTFTFSSVALTSTGGSAVNLQTAGTVNIFGGTIDGAGGNGIESVNTALTATGLTLGGNHALTINGIGVHVTNNDGTARTVDISNDSIRSNGAGILTTDGGTAKELTLVLDGNTIETLAGGAKAISVTGGALNSTIVKSINGLTVTANGTGGGVLFNRVTFDASGTALTGTAVNGGNWNIGQDTTHRVLNDGLHFDGPTGDLELGTLNIFNNAGTGLFVDTKTLGTTFSFSTTGGVVDTTGGTAMNIDPLTVNLTFTSVTSAHSGGAGVIVNGLTSGSTLTIGTTTVSFSGGSGIVVQNSNGAHINFGTTTVTSPGGSGIDLSGAGGANVTFGTTMVTNPGASGINMSGATGTFIFGDTTINGTAAGQTAFNLNGGNADVTALDLNINGGGIGIDLRKTINGHTVTVTNGGTIQNVGVGVQLGGGTTGDFSQTADAFFTFDTTGGHNSTISGTVAIEARGLVSTSSNVEGTYDFRNVTNLVGAENFEPVTGTPFFVAASAHGTGDGSTPGNAAAVSAIAGTPAGTFIILVNDGNTINLGASTITLQNNDHVDTFGSGRTFAGGTAPVNILLPGVPQYTDPFGHGAATVTGTGTLFTAASNDLFQNFTINLGGGTAISATGITGLNATNLTITGTGNVFNLSGDSGTIGLSNNTITTSGGQLLNVNGGNANITLAAGTGSVSNTGGSGVSVTNTTGGSVTITGVSVTGATSTPLVFDNNKATFNITGSTFNAAADVTLLNVDATASSTTALKFDATDHLTQTNSGTIAIIGGGARDIDLSAQNFTNTGTTAANVINVTGQTGGTISFGTVGITGYNNAAGTAVNLQGTGGTVSFADLDVTTTAGAGVNVGGITFAPGSTPTINATGGSALVMNGTTISGGAATFASVSDANAGAGNAGISLTNVAGSTTFTTVNLSGTSTNGIALNNAGTVAVLGGTIDGSSGDGITSTNTALTATGLTIGGTAVPGGNGITIVNNDGTARVVDLSNDTITALGDAIHTTDGGHAGELSLVLDGNTLATNNGGNFALSVTGSGLNSTTINSMNGGTVIANGAGGGVLFNEVTFDAVTGGAIQQVTGGNWNIGQGTFANQRVGFNGLDFEGPTGDLAFGTLNIFNDSGIGLLVNTKTLATTFSLSNTGGTINTVNDTAVSLDPLTANLTFSSVTSSHSLAGGVVLNTVGGTVALGAVSVTSATDTGLSVVNSSAAVTASSVTVNGASTGLQFGANTGSFEVTGATSLTSIGATGIDASNATGTYNFDGSTTITGTQHGINFIKSDVMFTTASLAITGNGTAGSIGIDLSGSLNPNGTNSATPNILLATGAGQTATINNVGTGVLLGNAANGSAGAYMKYGNQTPTSSGGSGSQINVIGGGKTIDTTHLTSTSGFVHGRYEFTGVAFTGAASFQAAANFFFVAANATGSGDGSSTSNVANAATLLSQLGLNALANKTIVLINDGSVITLANTANLDANTNIDGFGNGNSVAAFTIPVNVILDAFTGTVADPTGLGAATLTTAAGHNLINLQGGNSIKNVTLSGGNFVIAGTSTNLTVQGDTITSGASGVFSFTNSTGTVTLTNNTISGGGSLLTVSGGSAGISLTKGTGTIANTAGSGVNISGTTGGSVTLTGLNVTGATGTPLTFDNNKATFAITNSTFAVNAGVTLLNVDTTTGGSTQTLAFDNTNTLTQTSGTIAIIGTGARNIDLSALNFTNTGTTAANVIQTTGQTGGTISFGNVGITGYNNAAGTAVSLAGTAGTVSFADLDIATTAGAGLNVGGITFAPGSSSTISATGGSAVVMNGTTLSGGTATFASVSATTTGGVAGISLTNTVGTTAFTTVNINGTGAASGIVLNKAGTANILGGTIDGTSANGIDSTNTTLTATGLTIGGTTPPAGNGITVANSDSTARVVNLSNDTITAVGDAIHTTDSAVAGNLVLTLDGNTLQTTTTGNFALNVAGSALNSTIVKSMNGGTVTGGTNSGGVFFNRVTFDASGATLSGTQVNAGAWTIGANTSPATRVQGNGLNFQGPTGNLAFTTLNISNNAGTGLLVNTKTLGTTFTLSNTGGAVDTTNGTALNLDPLTANLTFPAVKSTNAPTSGVILNTVAGSVSLGAVTVSGATNSGLSLVGSSANVTLNSLTVTTSANGLTVGNNTGTFEVTGNTSLTDTTAGIVATNATGTYKFDGTTGITAPTGIAANGASGSWTFTGLTTINFSGANRGLDLRNTQFTLFQTGNITITGDGTTSGSIAVDLSGSKSANGAQPVTTPNITLADVGGRTAVISGVTTGVLLGSAADGSAGAYFVYGNQTAGSSGSSIAVNGGGTTIDTTNLTSTTDHSVGRYEFTGVAFTGQSTFEGTNPNFIFVGSAAAGADSGADPNDRISMAQFLASDNTSVFLAGKTIIFVNDGSINFGSTTLNMGTGTTVEGFGNLATVVVPGGVQPVNVIGDNFHPGGGSFTDFVNGAATLTATNTTNVITLSNGDTVQNININGGLNQIIGSGTAGFTLSGVNQTGAAGSAISLTNSTGTIAMTGGSIGSAAGPSILVDGGTSTLSYSGTVTSSSGHSVVVQNRTGGSATFSGTITDTGTGILLQNNSGGTTTFSGANDSIHTGAAQAITLGVGNAGSTMLFTGGGLSIQTTSATGFGATGGGTVGVTGTGNTITSTTGTALSLNGVAIDSNGFILQSVSANGAVNGIALTSLTGGGTSGVQVTGTGSTAGSGGTIQNTTGAAVSLTTLGSLGGGVTLNNMNITGGGGIVGSTFGTLGATNDSVSATNAAALSLTSGTITAGSTFSTLSSSGSATNGVLLSGVGGSFTANAGSITNATGAAWSVVGGSVSVTYSGGITQGNNAALVSVTGGHTGTLTFQTGTLNATAGTGLQFDNADGTYNFNGTTTLNGGDAGIDILNGSGGSFNFGSGVAITNPTGGAFKVDTGTASVIYNGNITNNAGLAILVQNTTGGSVSFIGGSLTDSGSGIEINGAQGSVIVAFGSTAMTGNGILVQGSSTQNASGTFTFTNIALGNAITGTMFHVANTGAFRLTGTVNLNNVDITSTDADRTVLIEGMGVNGSVVFDSASVISATGGNNNGILVQNNNLGVGPTVTFNGAITASTGANTAINLLTNTNATISFTGGLNLTTTSGTGFNATGGGTVIATQNNTSIVNTISAGSGVGLDIANTTIGASGVTFRSISSGAGATDGIVLDTTGTLGGLTVTGNGSAGTGGTISGKTGADGSTTSGIGIYLNNTRNVSLAWMDIEGNQNYGIRGNSVTSFTLNHSTVGTTATNGTSNTADIDPTGYQGEGSIRFYNLFGTNSISNSTVDKGFAKTIAVSNDTGTLTNLTINNSTVRNSLTASTASDALYLQTTGTATVATLTVNGGSIFDSFRQNAIDTNAQNGSTMTINVLGNTFKNTNTNYVNASNILVFNGSGANTLVTFDVENNTFTQGDGVTDPVVATGINPGRILTAGTVGGSGTFHGKLIGNTFGTLGVSHSGGGPGADNVGLFANGDAGANGDSKFLIQNNIFQQYGQSGVQVGATGGTAVIDATFLGNTFRSPGSIADGAFAAIWAYSGANTTPADHNVLNILIGGAGANKNLLTGSDPNGADDIFLGSSSPGSSVINLSSGVDPAGTAPATVIIDNNTVPPAEAYGDDGVTTINVISTAPLLPP
ncbi:MAG: inverse autotransporter beta domain-containing protein [Chthoniobacter sp.]|nr:inverse autotransporter beta domain-containing protein [Chthoniobacter sp.]